MQYSSNINYNNPINVISFPENDMIINNNSFLKLDDNNINYDDDDPPCSSFNYNFLQHFNNFPNSPATQMYSSQELESSSTYESVYLQFYDLFHQQPESVIDGGDTITNNNNIVTTDLNENSPVVPNDDVKEDAKKIKLPIIASCGKKAKSSRCSKKDRHSKIITASGPRDRRMRLSLDVARRFFQLQDILGYDKASRTVDWLLNSSRDAIKELIKIKDGSRTTTALSTTTTENSCEDQVVHSSSTWDNNNNNLMMSTLIVAAEKKNTKTKKKKVVDNKNKVGGSRTIVRRESRKIARERARERTSQKKRLLMMMSSSSSNIDDVHVINIIRGSTSTRDADEEEEKEEETVAANTLFCCTGPTAWIANTSTTVFDYQDDEEANWN